MVTVTIAVPFGQEVTVAPEVTTGGVVSVGMDVVVVDPDGVLTK